MDFHTKVRKTKAFYLLTTLVEVLLLVVSNIDLLANGLDKFK